MSYLGKSNNAKVIFKRRIIIIAILIILVLSSVLTYHIDKNRAYNGERPIFIFRKGYFGDGGTAIYYGLGYQIIMWKQLPGEGKEGYYMGVEAYYLFNMVDPLKGPNVELEFIEE